jgi:phage repressor protein C with HTH and peptisase S24 domain
VKISEWVKAARLHKGMTQEQLGAELNVTKGNVSGWENGRHEPGYAQLLTIESVTGYRLTPDTHPAGGIDYPPGVDIPAFSRVARAMEPIKTWEYDEVMPDGEYAMVPRLDVKLSGGHGHDGAQQLDFGFDDGELRAYSADWIRKRRLKPSKLRVLKATGRSMERTIFDGDDLLVDLGNTLIVDGAVYALWYEGSERVKRLFRIPGGGLRISSDNKDEFPEIVLGPEYLGHVYIIGRVIDRSGAGGL